MTTPAHTFPDWSFSGKPLPLWRVVGGSASPYAPSYLAFLRLLASKVVDFGGGAAPAPARLFAQRRRATRKLRRRDEEAGR